MRYYQLHANLKCVEIKPHHKRLYHNAINALKAHYEDRLGTLFRRPIVEIVIQRAHANM